MLATFMIAICACWAQTQATQQGVCRLPTHLVPLPDVPEASGVAVSRRTPGVLWSHNDSGPPAIFALDAKGTTKGRVRIAGATVEDWEDIAVGACPQGSCLYVADIGDNNATRRRITIYRVPEPAPGDSTTPAAEAFHATYPDGAHDAEAFFVTEQGDLFVVTKGEGEPVALYRFPRSLSAGSTVQLQRVTTLQIGDGSGGAKDQRKTHRVTAADASSDGRWIVLRTNDRILIYRTQGLISGRGVAAVSVDLSALHEPQGEGVAFGADGSIYLVGEGGGRVHRGTLAHLECSLPR